MTKAEKNEVLKRLLDSCEKAIDQALEQAVTPIDTHGVAEVARVAMCLLGEMEE